MTLLLVAAASAAQLVMQLDSADIAVGQTVGLTVQITDAMLRRPPRVDAPAAVHVEYISSSQEMTFLNFKQTTVETLRYQVQASSPGDYTLGPLSVALPGGTLTAPAVKLHVGAAPEAPTGVEALEAAVATETAWVGQVLVYHLRYATARRLVGARLDPPDFDGWTAEPGVAAANRSFDLGNGSGSVHVEEAWYAYRTQKSGKLLVPATHMLAQFAVARRRRDPLFDDLFQDTQNETVVSPALSLSVKSLPKDGRPASFSGLVGAFTVTATPSATQVKVGDTVTLDVTVTGDGGLGGFTLPAWTEDGFRIYDDAPTTSAAIQEGKLVSTATLKRAIVPERPGSLPLPPLNLSWFDPSTGKYVEQTLPALTLEVTGAASAASVEGFSGPEAKPKAGVDSLGEDILPVRTDVSLSAPWPGAWAWLACAPGAVLLLGQLAPRLRPRARGIAEKAFGFADLPEDPEGRLAGLERIFREAAGRRLGRPAPELKREDVATLGEEAEAIYKELDLARYRGGRDLPEARVRAWVGGGK